ncbi:MAG: threonylcarbamoyl-AMP synthase [Muribaculaceae bacterium]|nr:threonylcarbamoyl-AMP synthase [Muribaculaceae bacterium]
MINQDDITNALNALKAGGVILYPTDTIWGIGCDATNAEAVKKIFEIKQRADSKSMLALVDDISMLERYVYEMPDVAYQLIEAATTPITIIYDHAINLAPNLIANDGSVGLRVTDEPFSKQLCRQFRRPIVSTSANISGKPAPKSFAEIANEIKEKVDYVVTYRQDETINCKPSNIIRLKVNGEISIIR